MVTFQDEYGSGIEVLPKDTVWTPGVAEAETQARELSRFLATHAALSVAMSQEAIEVIGTREGWLVRWCNRGPFQVMELWIENNFLLELLTRDMTADYINLIQPDAYTSFLTEVAAANAPDAACEKRVATPKLWLALEFLAVLLVWLNPTARVPHGFRISFRNLPFPSFQASNN